MLLSEALGEFQRWGMIKYSPRTMVTYLKLIERFIRFTKDTELEKVSTLDVSNFYEFMRLKNYETSTVAYHMIALRQFFKYFFLQRKINWDYQLVPVPKYVSHSISPITPKEAKQIIDGIETNTLVGLRNKALFSFLYASGLRVSELCDLRLSDLKIDEQYGNILSKKNQQKRMIFWDRDAHSWLLLYLERREIWCTSDYLFISMNRGREGGKLTTRSVQRFIEHCRPSRHISAHSFRHGLGSRAVKADIHPRYVQKILGHKNLVSQQCYLDVYDQDVVQAYRKIHPF